MIKYILKRLGLTVLILLGVSLIIYVLIRLMPVDFIEKKIAEMNQGGATIDQATIDNMKSMYGLTDDTFLGVLKGYWSWLTKLVKPTTERTEVIITRLLWVTFSILL